MTLDDCLQRYGWSKSTSSRSTRRGRSRTLSRVVGVSSQNFLPLILYEVKSREELHLELVGKLCRPRIRFLSAGSGTRPAGSVRRLPRSRTVTCSICFAARKTVRQRFPIRGLLLDSSSIATRIERKIDSRISSRPASAPIQLGQQAGDATLRSRMCAISGSRCRLTAPSHRCFDLLRDQSGYRARSARALQRTGNAVFGPSRPYVSATSRYLRLASAARVASDYGARSVAVAALAQLYEKLEQESICDLARAVPRSGKAVRYDCSSQQHPGLALGRRSRGIRTTQQLLLVLHRGNARRRLELIAFSRLRKCGDAPPAELIRARFPKG